MCYGVQAKNAKHLYFSLNNVALKWQIALFALLFQAKKCKKLCFSLKKLKTLLKKHRIFRLKTNKHKF